MKRIGIGTMGLLAFAILAGVVFVVRAAIAQRPEVKFLERHRSPVTAEITFRDGTKSKVVIVGTGLTIARTIDAHKFAVVGPGDSDVSLWLDTISSIDEITDKEGTFHLKNGDERRVKWVYTFGQMADGLFMANRDGGTEMVQASKVRQVKLLNVPRKDKEGHAMLDDWRFSPYTGEKLPAVAE